MAISMQIGTLSFTTKAAATDFFKEMLDRYVDGDAISAGDANHLQALLDRHPEREQKVGCGIRYFYRGGTPVSTSCFWLERLDGSTTEFSYHKCIEGRAESLHQDFAEACRDVIAPDLIKAKHAHFERNGDATGRVRCELSGEQIGPDEAHLDHAAPMTFEVLVKTFLTCTGIALSRSLLSPKQDQQFRSSFADPALAERFRQFHHATAELRLIKTRLNLSLGGSQRIKKLKMPVRVGGGSDG